MVHPRTIAALVCAGVLVPVATAWAQGVVAWTDRGFVNVSGGYQAGKQDVTTSSSFPLYDETATLSTSRTIKGGGFFDVTGGMRVTGNWAAGVSISHRSASSDATVQGSIPDPIFYDANRSVTTSAPGLAHRETWVAILGTYVLPAIDKMDVMVFVGPALAHVSHDVPSSATVTEGDGGPYLNLTADSVTKSVWGVMGGVDVRYLVTTHFGAGAVLRYDHATANISSSTKLTLGGFQIAGGLRVRF